MAIFLGMNERLFRSVSRATDWCGFSAFPVIYPFSLTSHSFHTQPSIDTIISLHQALISQITHSLFRFLGHWHTSNPQSSRGCGQPHKHHQHSRIPSDSRERLIRRHLQRDCADRSENNDRNDRCDQVARGALAQRHDVHQHHDEQSAANADQELCDLRCSTVCSADIHACTALFSFPFRFSTTTSDAVALLATSSGGRRGSNKLLARAVGGGSRPRIRAPRRAKY